MSDDAKSTTYFQIARGSADEAGGRFARQQPSAIVGADPLPLVAPAWSSDLAKLGPEPPLGFDVNEVPDLGFVAPASWETIAPRSRTAPLAAPAAPAPSTSTSGDAVERGGSASTIRRRL